MNEIPNNLAAEEKKKDCEGNRALHCLRAAAGKRGVVLIAVLWSCAFIMWAGLQLSAQTRLLGEDELHSISQTRSLYLAIGGCYEALARMTQAQPVQSGLASDQNWQPDGEPRVVVYNTGIAVVIIESDDQKINVNNASAAQLTQVLETAGADGQSSQALAARIADFVKTQNQNASQLQGQPNTGLGQGLNHDTDGFNGPLTSLDQLLLVPGVSQELFYGYERGMAQWAARVQDFRAYCNSGQRFPFRPTDRTERKCKLAAGSPGHAGALFHKDFMGSRGHLSHPFVRKERPGAPERWRLANGPPRGGR